MPTDQEPGLIAFVFDYVDPRSYVWEREVRRFETAAGGIRVKRLGLEVTPPPLHPVEPMEGEWALRFGELVDALGDEGVVVEPPFFVPWSRKAHELFLLAEEKGVGGPVHEALLDGFFQEGLDVGRVDQLVKVGTAAGMDFTETRATLDVDRLTERVEEIRSELSSRGITAPPALVAGDRVLGPEADARQVAAFLEEARMAGQDEQNTARTTPSEQN
jgi:predicted DsbA family dithiol-disulfide isomerase